MKTYPSTQTPTRTVVKEAISLACQAPSLHNSQPWRWVVRGRTIELYNDGDRMLPFTDTFGRQMIISCGAALHHAQVAFASLGWAVHIERLPEIGHPYHLATMTLIGCSEASDRDYERAAAIRSRHTDRHPFGALTDVGAVVADLRAAADEYGVTVEPVVPEDIDTVAKASEQAVAARRYDLMYRTELQWWTGHLPMAEGVPRESLPTYDDSLRVAIARDFPLAQRPAERPEVTQDDCTVVVLATRRDSLGDWLRCGEALSAVLLASTARGLATCALTHITEVPDSRRAIGCLLTTTDLPQVLVRIGVAGKVVPHVTRRRPLSDVLRFEEE